MITRLAHTGFVVKDLDKSVEFYRDAVGLTLVRTTEVTGEAISQVLGYDDVVLKVAFMDAGNGHALELLHYVHPPGADRPSEERNTLGATHLAFDVDDMDGTFQRLIDNGARQLNPPAELRGRMVCYLQDPDGNWVELIQPAP